MLYFALQVRSSSEQAFIQKASALLALCPVQPRFILLKRSLNIRRQGKTVTEELPLFPGYVFLENFTSLGTDVIEKIRSTKGFCRFLKSNREITPLDGPSLDILQHFMKIGETALSSKVYFDDNDRIVIAEGPLKGLEGSIVKVDRRKKRAKVKIDFNDNEIFFDLAFDIIEKGDSK
jgi:transcription termination/antitermination protein NusG